jgi:hypothetical protein
MGIKQSPDIVQQIMEDLFCSFDEVEVKIDEIGDEVLKLVYKPNKLGPQAVGPYSI